MDGQPLDNYFLSLPEIQLIPSVKTKNVSCPVSDDTNFSRKIGNCLPIIDRMVYALEQKCEPITCMISFFNDFSTYQGIQIVFVAILYMNLSAKLAWY